MLVFTLVWKPLCTSGWILIVFHWLCTCTLHVSLSMFKLRTVLWIQWKQFVQQSTGTKHCWIEHLSIYLSFHSSIHLSIYCIYKATTANEEAVFSDLHRTKGNVKSIISRLGRQELVSSSSCSKRVGVITVGVFYWIVQWKCPAWSTCAVSVLSLCVYT